MARVVIVLVMIFYGTAVCSALEHILPIDVVKEGDTIVPNAGRFELGFSARVVQRIGILVYCTRLSRCKLWFGLLIERSPSMILQVYKRCQV